MFSVKNGFQSTVCFILFIRLGRRPSLIPLRVIDNMEFVHVFLLHIICILFYIVIIVTNPLAMEEIMQTCSFGIRQMQSCPLHVILEIVYSILLIYNGR